MKNIKIAILGGDERQKYLSKLLQENFDTYTFGLEKDNLHDLTQDFDVYILPIPVSKDGIHLNSTINTYKLSDINLPENSIIFGGNVLNFNAIDYLKCENLTILNAIPTAEGALQIAFEKMPTTLAFSNSLVVGNGRIGKILSKKLNALGSNTTVIARKPEDFADILSNNLEFSTMEKVDFSKFDVIFNTVPTRIFDMAVLKKIPKNTLIIDLSSKPFGVDFDACEKLSINAISALSLPGKVAPKTASKFIYDTTLDILRDMEVI